MNEKNVNNNKKILSECPQDWKRPTFWNEAEIYSCVENWQAVIDGHVILLAKESGLWNLGSFAVESASSGPGSWKAD